MFEFLFGFYVCGMLLTFLLTCFLVGLSGDNRELWRIPVYPLVWPVVVVVSVYQWLRGVI